MLAFLLLSDLVGLGDVEALALFDPGLGRLNLVNLPGLHLKKLDLARVGD